MCSKVFENMLFRRSNIKNETWSLINVYELQLFEEW